jgi:hypothetical protein
MSEFWKPLSSRAINGQWQADLTRWLEKCKGIANVTQQDLDKWDGILNSASSPSDIASFCDFTGWKTGPMP